MGCLVAGGHAWLQGGMHGCERACMAAGGLCGCGGCGGGGVCGI